MIINYVCISAAALTFGFVSIYSVKVAQKLQADSGKNWVMLPWPTQLLSLSLLLLTAILLYVGVAP